MFRRSGIALIILAAGVTAGCHHNVKNPIADVNSKQPDKVLFDRSMDAMKKGKFDVARITLQTLINTYPDSEYVARAKLSVGDSWYAEGGGTALAQAEAEYKDFITFFPNMPEAAEAQLKVANIHYRQMEKADRDFTHAKRAEEEYRQLILQFPDSQLVPQAKQKLRDVQEILAEREYRIGRFYFLRESWAAAIARLKSVADAYPLYSKADDTLMMIGDAYERQIDVIRENKALNEATKGAMIEKFGELAAESYARVVARYPSGGRAERAKEQLIALHRPVPQVTAEALAESKAEEESRQESGRWARVMLNFRKHPDYAPSAKVGEPTITPPPPTNATDIVKQTTQVAVDAVAATQPAAAATTQPAEASGKTAVEVVPKGAQPAVAVPGAPAPPTIAPPVAAQPDTSGIEDLAAPKPADAAPAATPAATPAPANAPTTEAPPPPPTQVNEAAQPGAATATSNVPQKGDSTSSKGKKKKDDKKKEGPKPPQGQ